MDRRNTEVALAKLGGAQRQIREGLAARLDAIYYCRALGVPNQTIGDVLEMTEAGVRRIVKDHPQGSLE